jgi:hypothetical protein
MGASEWIWVNAAYCDVSAGDATASLAASCWLEPGRVWPMLRHIRRTRLVSLMCYDIIE